MKEDQICKNCKYYMKVSFMGGKDPAMVCDLQYKKDVFLEVKKDFGCTEFKRKEMK